MLSEKIKAALEDIRNGKPIIVVDSYDRENEGDLMIAAEKATPQTLAFIAKEARGIMCIPTPKFMLDRLGIPMSPSNNNDKFSTPFTVSVDARDGVTTGVSVEDRMVTIGLVLDENTQPRTTCISRTLIPSPSSSWSIEGTSRSHRSIRSTRNDGRNQTSRYHL